MQWRSYRVRDHVSCCNPDLWWSISRTYRCEYSGWKPCTQLVYQSMFNPFVKLINQSVKTTFTLLQVQFDGLVYHRCYDCHLEVFPTFRETRKSDEVLFFFQRLRLFKTLRSHWPLPCVGHWMHIKIGI